MNMENTSMPLAVIDTSFMVAAIFSAFAEDENKTAADFLEEIIKQNGQLYVPQIFWYEFSNVLVSSSRPKKNGNAPKLSSDEIIQIETILADYPIYTDPQPDFTTRMRIREIAEKNNLSYYDASYYELALRYNIPLKSFDTQLMAVFNK